MYMFLSLGLIRILTGLNCGLPVIGLAGRAGPQCFSKALAGCFTQPL